MSITVLKYNQVILMTLLMKNLLQDKRLYIFMKLNNKDIFIQTPKLSLNTKIHKSENRSKDLF